MKKWFHSYGSVLLCNLHFLFGVNTTAAAAALCVVLHVVCILLFLDVMKIM